DGERVDAGGEEREMSAVQNGDIAQRDVARPLQTDRLVALPVHAPQRNRLGIAGAAGGRAHADRAIAALAACPRRARAAPRQAAAVDQTGPDDRDVFDVDRRDQAVAPVAVAAVLIPILGVVIRKILRADTGRPARL